MKKIRTILTAIAIVVSIGAALATGQGYNCAFQQQYIAVGGTWVPVYNYASDYVCVAAYEMCTYYRPNPIFQPNMYVPCREGRYYMVW